MTPFLWLGSFLALILIGGCLLLFWMRFEGGARVKTPADERASELLAAGWLPLVDCPRDRDACLRCLQVDRCVVHRLLELGLTPGTQLRVVQDAGGPMLVSVRGSRVALGRDLAERLWVELPVIEPIDLPAPQS